MPATHKLHLEIMTSPHVKQDHSVPACCKEMAPYQAKHACCMWDTAQMSSFQRGPYRCLEVLKAQELCAPPQAKQP